MDFNNNYSEQQETGQQIPVQTPVQPNPNPVPPKNALSIGALVIGIIGLALFWTFYFGIIFGSLAIILAVLSKGYYKKMNGTAKGGFITGLIALIIDAAFFIIIIVYMVVSLLNYSKDFFDGRDSESKGYDYQFDYDDYKFDFDDYKFDYDDYEFDYDDYEFDYDDFDYEDFDF